MNEFTLEKLFCGIIAKHMGACLTNRTDRDEKKKNSKQYM